MYYYIFMLIVSIRLAGNMHLNIAAASYASEIESALEPFVYELVGESLEPAVEFMPTS